MPFRAVDNAVTVDIHLLELLPTISLELGAVDDAITIGIQTLQATLLAFHLRTRLAPLFGGSQLLRVDTAIRVAVGIRESPLQVFGELRSIHALASSSDAAT